MPKTIRVLVVDDELSVGDALRVILNDSGCQAIVATCGRDAFEKARTLTFDVAIIDVGLPDMSGLDLLCVLREANPALKVILMTAFPTPEIVTEATRLGAIDLLVKPFPPLDVLNVIHISERER